MVQMMVAKMFQSKWIFMAIFLFSTMYQCLSQPFQYNTSTKATSNRPRIFSPRMDYDEWTPLGRGDPLKNDPTFDYVPPVLDRVQYWLDSQSSTEPSSKRDILVLGVTAKKTSPKIPDHFLKFIDGPKFTRNHYHSSHQQQQQDNHENYHKDFMGSAGAEPPKIIRATNFRNNGEIDTNPLDFRNNHNRIQTLPASYYPSPYYNKNSKPLTMMMPPPIQQSDIKQEQHQYGIQTEEAPTSILMNLNENHDSNPVAPRPFNSQSISDTNEKSISSSITFDKSNLVYQSSQTYDRWTASSSNNNNSPGQSVNWNANDEINKSYDHYDDDHNVAASANHEVVIGQNANIIVDGDNINNEQVVMGRKEIIPSLNNTSNYNENNNEIDSIKMHIVMANSSSTLSNNNDNNDPLKRATVAVVMPSNYIESENNSRYSEKSTTIESTTFVSTSSIKVSPSRQYSTITTSSTRITPRIPVPISIQNVVHQPVKKLQIMPNLSTTTMIMQNTNLINSTIPLKVPLPSIMSLQYEATSGMTQQHLKPKEEIVQPLPNPEQMMNDQSPLAIILNAQEIEKMTTNSLNSRTMLMSSTSITTSATPITTASIIKSTVDPIFLNYKKPLKSTRAPMYLIIQGHSKVKTYKPTVNKYGVPVEKNIIDIESTTKRYMSKFDQFVNDNTRVVSTTRRNILENNHEVKAKEKRVKQDSLLSFVESGLSAFTASLPPPSLSSSSSPSSSTSLSSSTSSIFELRKK